MASLHQSKCMCLYSCTAELCRKQSGDQVIDDEFGYLHNRGVMQVDTAELQKVTLKIL